MRQPIAYDARTSGKPQPNRPTKSGRIDRHSVLRDDDFISCRQSARRSPRGFHQRTPRIVPLFRRLLGNGISVNLNEPRRFARANRRARLRLREQMKNRVFQRPIHRANPTFSACIRTISNSIPVACPLFAPSERAAACHTDLRLIARLVSGTHRTIVRCNSCVGHVAAAYPRPSSSGSAM